MLCRYPLLQEEDLDNQMRYKSFSLGVLYSKYFYPIISNHPFFSCPISPLQ